MMSAITLTRRRGENTRKINFTQLTSSFLYIFRNTPLTEMCAVPSTANSNHPKSSHARKSARVRSDENECRNIFRLM